MCSVIIFFSHEGKLSSEKLIKRDPQSLISDEVGGNHDFHSSIMTDLRS